jgi:hypothetical protein
LKSGSPDSGSTPESPSHLEVRSLKRSLKKFWEEPMAQPAAETRPARPGSGDRFYQLELRHREALKGDIGNLLRIQGVLVGGEGAQALLLLPETPKPNLQGTYGFPQHTLSLEEWTDFLERADDPEVLVMPQKAFHRKLRYEISGWVQQKVWKADGCKCMYCGREMGEVQLTVDHFVPLEMGGVNDTSNYLTACRKCNKDKGGQEPKDWCLQRMAQNKHGYSFYVTYLQERLVG